MVGPLSTPIYTYVSQPPIKLYIQHLAYKREITRRGLRYLKELDALEEKEEKKELERVERERVK